MRSLLKLFIGITVFLCAFTSACGPTSPNNSGAEAPFLISPTNNTIIKNNRPQFDWTDVERVGNYELFVSDTSGIAIIQQNNLTASYFNATTVLSDQKYYWKVRSRDGLGNWGDWSKRWSFTVDTHGPIAPTLSSPSNGTTINDNTPIIDWTEVAGAHQYELYLSSSSMTVVSDSTLTSSSYAVTSVLPDEEYSWRVRCRDGVGNWSGWSSTWSFIVGTTPVVSLSTSQLNFGDVTFSQSKNLSLRISNIGYVTLSITGINSTNQNFSVIGNTVFNIPPGTGQDITVRFTPPAIGSQSGVLQIENNSNENPKSVNLSGTGKEPINIDNIEGLVAFYPFNGNANDEIGNNDGIVNGVYLTTDRFGVNDKAFSLDGIDDYIDIGKMTQLNGSPAISISVWIKKTKSGSYSGILGKWNTASAFDNCFLLHTGQTDYIDHASFDIQFSDSTQYHIHTNNELNINEWIHLVATWENSNGFCGVYENGILKTSNYFGQGKVLYYHDNYNARIGNWGSQLQSREKYFFGGALDDIRIYTRLLKEDEIFTLFHENGY